MYRRSIMFAGTPDPASIPAPTQADQVQWYDLMGKWQAAVTDFENARQALLAQAATAQQDPNEYAAYQHVLATMQAAESKITEIANALGDVKAWLSGAWDQIKGYWQSAESSVLSFFGLSGLGFAPVVWLIGAGVVTGAVAYIGHVASSAWDESKRLQMIQQLMGQGYSASQAAATVTQTLGDNSSFMGSLSSTAKTVVIGGGVVLALWWGYRAWSSRRAGG